ncbi:MAG TPA: hypothetical protein VGV07_15220 [Devosia sp.]|jgi:hypothetical protein|uniref:hypothetical protein n=1 Tax=Devosia sp. TaxID=1871048 RepID=UPI002DDCCC9E|nr:hypothetical protein [Devosia sp.]HEV2516605.1 hypothetical protein [Devosia sp.]
MDLIPNGVTISNTAYKGRPAVQVTMPSSAYQDPSKEALIDRDFMAWQPVDFHNGTIEVDVASVLAPDAPAYARGFIGLAFRIDAAKRFESIYLRPTNSQVDDQIRRNRTIQYVAYPDFTFPRLRQEEPGKYEAYADIDLEQWINIRVVVKDARAELFLNSAPRPAFMVTDLKLGPAQKGGVGLWIEAGTVGYFANLRITG